jgi:hypothetical protein
MRNNSHRTAELKKDVICQMKRACYYYCFEEMAMMASDVGIVLLLKKKNQL